MSGMSNFLSSFHYAVKHCLTILWQILEQIQKSHFIFPKMLIKYLPKSEQEVPALVYPPCQICNSDTTNGSLVCFLALSVSIQFAVRLAKCLQILFSVSDSLWIWGAFVPSTATHPMSSQHSNHTTEPHFMLPLLFFFFSSFCITHASGNSTRKATEYEKHLCFIFFFQVGSGFALDPSQWVDNLRNNTEIPGKTLASKAFIWIEAEFLCQQSMPECI